MRCARAAAAKASRRCASEAGWESRWSSRSRLPDVRIDREALTAIVAHARRDAPNECCGLLVGRLSGPVEASPYRPDVAAGADVPGPSILEAIPCSNGAEDPTRRYEISPVDYFAQIHRCRRINAAQSDRFAVVGAYHSHPRGGPEPSKTDVEQAFRDFVFLIVGFRALTGGMEIRAYCFQNDSLMPVPLVVVD
jgi:proteasome lid subunit RPN8/RPN11